MNSAFPVQTAAGRAGLVGGAVLGTGLGTYLSNKADKATEKLRYKRPKTIKQKTR